MQSYGASALEWIDADASAGMRCRSFAERPYAGLLRLADAVRAVWGRQPRAGVCNPRRDACRPMCALIKEKHVCLATSARRATAHGSAHWAGAVERTGRRAARRWGCGEARVVDIAYRLKAKTNPQFPGLELELVDLRSGLNVPASNCAPARTTQQKFLLRFQCMSVLYTENSTQCRQPIQDA